MQQPGARYGIWGVPTNTERMAPTVSPFEHAMAAAKGTQDLFGQYYKNKLESANAGLKQGELQQQTATMPDLIAAMNAKNRTDTQYYPQMQAAKLQQEQQTIKEIQARTGLSYAQAKVAAAHVGLIGAQTQVERNKMNPLSEYNQIYQAYQNAPEGSQQKAMYAGILASKIGKEGLPVAMSAFSGVQPPSAQPASRTTGAGAGGIPLMSAGGQLQENPLGGGGRSTFHQAFMETPEGPTTIESPTTNSATRGQMRTEAHSEIQALYPKVMAGLKPYQGPLGSTALAKDSYIASTSPNSAKGKEAQKRLIDYETAKRFLPELANINARQSSGQAPGIEMNREFQSAMFPGLPGRLANYFIPSSVQAEANQNYLPLQSNAVESAIAQERGGYVQPGQPAWAQQSENMQPGFLGIPTPVPAKANQNQARTNTAQSNQKIEESKILNGTQYVKINGKWHQK
jgi:hypothetical protein